MIWDFVGRRPQLVRDYVVSIGDGPYLSYKLSKVWRVHVWQNYNEKTDFHVQLLNGFIPSHKVSPKFCHVISQVRTTLYWNHIVHDRQGSAAHEIPNHWISPSLRKSLNVGFWGSISLSREEHRKNPRFQPYYFTYRSRSKYSPFRYRIYQRIIKIMENVTRCKASHFFLVLNVTCQPFVASSEVQMTLKVKNW